MARDTQQSAESAAAPTPEQIARNEAFMVLYSKWLAARAAREDPTQHDEDVCAGKRLEAVDEAERQLLVTPAPTPWAVWLKWEVLELGVADDYRDGPRDDARTLLALGAIKADLIAFEFGGVGA